MRLTPPSVRVGRKTWGDYLALARHHYRGGRPGVPVRVLAARDGGVLAGVLVVSMPALNGPWRARAWPSRGCGKREAARRLNATVRTISRVIVHPRYRGLGVGTALVRAYLAGPDAARCEVIAAMGRYVPFLERAGMRRVNVPRSARDARLAKRLRAMGIEAWRLVDVDESRWLLARCAALRRAVRAWAWASRATRGVPVGPALAAMAGSALTSRPAVFVHGA